MKCPACGSTNVYRNLGLIKLETGDWGICKDCHFVIRSEVLCPNCNGVGKLPKDPDNFVVCSRCGGNGTIKSKKRAPQKDRK